MPNNRREAIEQIIGFILIVIVSASLTFGAIGASQP